MCHNVCTQRYLVCAVRAREKAQGTSAWAAWVRARGDKSREGLVFVWQVGRGRGDEGQRLLRLVIIKGGRAARQPAVIVSAVVVGRVIVRRLLAGDARWDRGRVHQPRGACRGGASRGGLRSVGVKRAARGSSVAPAVTL